MNYNTQSCDSKPLLALETPKDHIALLTQGIETSKHGTVLVGWKPLQTPEWFKVNLAVGQDILSKYTNEPDVFITPNEFYNWRLVRLLSGLTAFYIDIDDHDNDKPDMLKMRCAVDDVVLTKGIPEPNFIVYSSRGLHVYWLIEKAPKHALPRWKAVQKVLCNAFNADGRALDATRLLRLVGTTHSKTGLKITGEPIHNKRYDFNWFCDEVLPFTQAEVRDFQAAKARQGKTSTRGRPKLSQGQKYGSIFERWYKVYTDLLKIQDWFWFGGMHEAGHREHMLYHTANALSWFTHSDALVNEIRATAKIMIPSYHDQQITSYCSSVISRAKRTQETPDAEFRYKYSRAKLWEDFEPIIGSEPDLVQQLRAIIPDELRNERQKNRDRVAEGRWAKNRTKSADLPELKKKVRKMLSQGMTQQYIASQLGITQGRVSQIKKIITKNKG